MDNQGKADPNCDYSHHQQLIQQQQQQMSEDEIDLRRGPWTVEEDFTLINYIAHHGEGRWNSLARSAGLKRTGKSCRLRWLNYLRPDVRRGNITLEEQLLILELHSRWGNRWSKIAQHLPGRTDNEIKNYWRTRVQKHAKQLKCDVNSKQFKDTMRYLWMPRLVERIQAAGAGAASASAAPASSSTPAPANYNMNMSLNNYQAQTNNFNAPDLILPANLSGVARVQNMNAYTTPENSSAAASSESFGTPVSDLTECYNNYNNQGGSGSGSNNSSNNNINNNNNNNSSNQDYYHPGNHHQFSYGEQSLTSPTPAGAGYFNQGLDFMEQNGCQWMDGGDAASDALWNADEMWFFQQQFGSSNVV